MEQNLEKLVRISRRYGQDPDYVIAGGGNTSFKNNDKIWVKASGTSMINIKTEDFVCLDRQKLRKLSTTVYNNDPLIREEQVREDLYAAVLYPKDKRPSVETSLHETIGYSFVVHTHPTIVNGLLCSVNSGNIVQRLFGKDALYVEYTDPGYTLFKKIDAQLTKYRKIHKDDPKIIFLENHGVFVAANSTEEIERIYGHMILKISNKIKAVPKVSDRFIPYALKQIIELLKADTEFLTFSMVPWSARLITQYLEDKNEFEMISRPLTPDNIVYCKSNCLYIADVENILNEINAFRTMFGYYPKVIGIRGNGVLAMDESFKSAGIVLDVFRDMIKVNYLTQNFGGPRYLSQKQVEFIDNLEAEHYRRKISKIK
jgi:rhamnose utilization protein RhaD (predicted bifunctional aldolase and dehydrogenase)